MKLDEVELRSPSFDRFLFYYTSIFTILQPLGSGYHEIKVNELPDWDWAWSDGTKAANWGSRKGSLRVFVFVFFLPSYIPHLSMHLEKSRRLSVLWTIWNFSMISAEKVPGSFIFVIAVEWISPVKHRVQKRWPIKVAAKEECFRKIAVFLYNWLVSPWELPDKTGTWKVE